MPVGRAYDTERPFVAQHAFTFGERSYAPGDVFPWRALGVSERKLWSLWVARKVWHAAPRAETAPAAGDLAVLAMIGAAVAQPPPAAPKPAKRPRAGS